MGLISFCVLTRNMYHLEVSIPLMQEVSSHQHMLNVGDYKMLTCVISDTTLVGMHLDKKNRG
jgi:hypothetical protein